MKKNVTRNIHAFAGLLSGIFILLMSLSGAVLVFHENLDAVGVPGTGQENKTVTVDNGYKLIQTKYPQAQISHVVLPESSNRPYSFILYDPSHKNGKKALEVFVNPHTGTILKTRDTHASVTGWLSRFHNSLHLGKTGEWLLGLFALVFLLSLVTGTVLYRKNIFAVLLFRKNRLQKNNLHQVIGVWALVFNLMIAVTGFWMQRYVFKKEFYATYDYTPVLKASPVLSFTFDSAYAAIKKQYPGFTAAVIYFAQSNSGKTAVYGSRASNAYIHSRKFADAIMLDSAGGIAKTRFINEISAGDRYDIINSQLHMGRFGGWGIKIIYFVFGMTGALLSITGFLLWWEKRRQP